MRLATMAAQHTRSRASSITQRPSAAVTAERSLLATLEGGCQVPIGAHAHFEGSALHLIAMVASPDGTRVMRDRSVGDWRSGGARQGTGRAHVGRGCARHLRVMNRRPGRFIWSAPVRAIPDSSRSRAARFWSAPIPSSTIIWRANACWIWRRRMPSGCTSARSARCTRLRRKRSPRC